MDLTNMIPGGAGEEKTPQQQLSKEEYAAMKKQQREEVWAEVDAQAQAVFQNGDSLKGFLDFMAQCNTQKTPNLLLIYGQNPEATVVKSFDYWKKEHRSPKSGVHGYTYMDQFFHGTLWTFLQRFPRHLADVKSFTDGIACPHLPVFFIFRTDHIGVAMQS